MIFATEDALLGRMRWRARRGTRELDRLLGWWLEHRFADADAGQRERFDAMLDLPDPLLWDWLTGQAMPEPLFATIIDEIRTAHRV